MTYYRLIDDINYNNRWYLGDIIGIDNWSFTFGKKLKDFSPKNSFRINVLQMGVPMDYTTNEAFSVPIVSQKLKDLLNDIDTLQFIPLKFEEEFFKSNYFIMVVTRKQDCVNEQLSEFSEFTKNDPIWPDLAGHIGWFSKLIINKEKVNNLDIFRIKKGGNFLIVSEKIKIQIEMLNATGTKFIRV